MYYGIMKLHDNGEQEYLDVAEIFKYSPELLANEIEENDREYPTPHIEYVICLVEE